MRTRSFIFSVIAATVLLVLGSAWLVHSVSEREALPGDAVAKPLPNLVVETLDGGTFNLAELAGEPGLLNFWATWCPPCEEEMPAIQAFHQARGEELQLLAVNYGEEREVVEAFVEKHGLTFTVILDPEGAVAAALGVTYLPTTMFVTADGIVRSSLQGILTPADLRRAARALR